MAVRTFLSLITLFGVSDAARILAMIPMPSYSHQVVFQPLWKELSLRGHQVTLLTTNPINDPSLTNLTEIDLSFSYNDLEIYLSEFIKAGNNFMKFLDLATQSYNGMIGNQLQHPQVHKLINDPNNRFDLFIGEYFMSPIFYIARKFNCPYIGVSTVDLNNMWYSKAGNPTHPILYPDGFFGLYRSSNLFQRVLLILFEVPLFLFITLMRSIEQEVVKKHFSDSTPVEEVIKNMSLVFVNGNPIFDSVRPLVPSIIQIGGTVERIHVKRLAKEIKHFLDKADEGFIYFSVGSNVNSNHIPNDTMNVILQTFQELPYKILWKYEESDFPNKPKNVMISKWVSQQEVLRHPNIRLFISHGGAQSVEEAFSARVPLVGMPFFVDQPYNIHKMVVKGCALSVDYKTMTKTEFKNTIVEVIKNPKYKNQITELADLAEDQPMTGLERAVWWTEYVIRHKGASHLRSPLFDIPWYQYYLFDVIAVILLGIIAIIGAIVVLVKLSLGCIRFFCCARVKLKEQ